MPVKVPNGNPGAVGYWGDPSCRFAAEAIGDKELAALQDDLLMMGRPMSLWLPVAPTDAGVVRCTCFKDTKSTSDTRCLTCYGTQYAPGYRRFMHETLFWSSAEYASFTLAGVERDTSIKPNRLRLSANALTGTITTQDKPFSNLLGASWEYDVAAFRKTPTDTIGVEVSVDSGVTWTALTPAFAAAGLGQARLRVTLTRAALTTEPPDFEIARLRHPQPDRLSPLVRDGRANSVLGAVAAGQVLVLRSAQRERVYRQQQLGRLLDWSADRGWTAPLNFYDVTIARDTPAARLTDRNAGGHPFLQQDYGVLTGERIAVLDLLVSEQVGTFLRQDWSDRIVQAGETLRLVW